MGLGMWTVSHRASESDFRCAVGDGNSAGMCEKIGATLDDLSPSAS